LQQQQQQQEQQQQEPEPGRLPLSPPQQQQQQQQQQLLPLCDAPAWHVARLVLREYADAVTRDGEGEPVPEATPALPVLQLASRRWPGRSTASGSGGWAAAASNAARPQAGAGAAAAAGACSMLGLASPVDVAQRVVLPAAVAWVRDNLARLPMLNVSSSRG
jgi:hypothetical protein